MIWVWIWIGVWLWINSTWISIPSPLSSFTAESGLSVNSSITRATTASILDYEGIIRTVKSGELRVERARRVENKLLDSEDYSTLNWQRTRVNILGKKFIPSVDDNTHYLLQNSDVSINRAYTYSARVKADGYNFVQIGESTGFGSTKYVNFNLLNGTIIFNNWGLDASITLDTDGYYIISVKAVANISSTTGRLVFSVLPSDLHSRFPSFIGDGTSGVIFDYIQLEDVTGKADQTASEYVSTGVLSYPYHSAGVDGVKYFHIKKDGSPLDMKPYVLVEKQSTNLLTDSVNSILSWANLSGGTGTVPVITQVTDSLFGTVSRLQATKTDTSTASYSFAYKTIGSLTTNNQVLTFWAKSNNGLPQDVYVRILGTDAITQRTIGIDWTRIELKTNVGVATASLGIGARYISDNNVDILISAPQFEQSTYSSSYIPTTTTAVTRSADILKYEFGGGNFPQEFCYYSEFEPLIDNNIDTNISNYRIFWTNWTAAGDEFRTYGWPSYNMYDQYAEWWWYYWIKNTDFNNTLKTKVCFNLSNTIQSYTKDWITLASEPRTQVVNHSGLWWLEIANWAWTVMPMKLYSANVYSPMSKKQLKKITTI